MGISGLLPLLKPIQYTKHLSEFAGQTLAVDAYVWLHRGVYACATELATGKRTHKYVDYAMHRVRLLRHHKIEPYIVLDGGPLPAKKHTENSRKARRDENLARANLLASQGRHKEAREYYVKCVDVTPQMAFQLIKALRAESVQYVVAPYEADAQLAYLERTGVVDGIITEDSDLLVFGCKTVLFKMDDVQSTITCISKDDFGAVTSAEGGMSLVGWSEVQFRQMAILSGCDYLPSIPGVGLKTAWTLLKKWRTADNVVRAIKLEGKKNVPRDYMVSFRLAELCFSHQRVYCPQQQRIVHLTPVGDEWDKEADEFVGGDMEVEVARKLAAGGIDPVTLLPMEDINPSFEPRALKALPLVNTHLNNKGKGKGKEREQKKPVTGGILNFFGPDAIITQEARKPGRHSIRLSPVKPRSAGRASGKRTLADAMDHDVVAKKKTRVDKKMGNSKYFEGPAPEDGDAWAEIEPVAGPSRLGPDKENAPLESTSDLSTQAQAPSPEDMDLDFDEYMVTVAQEDGYISPSPSCSRDSTADLSSPVRPRKSSAKYAADDWGLDPVSSPPSYTRVRRCASLGGTPPGGEGIDLFADTPQGGYGVDLSRVFGDEGPSEIGCYDDEERGVESESATNTPPTPSPATPVDDPHVVPEVFDDVDLEAEALHAHQARTGVVANGWRQRWSMDGRKETPKPVLRRRETTVTPAGRHPPLFPLNQGRTPPWPQASAGRARRGRTGLNFVEQSRESAEGIEHPEGNETAVKRLAQFRCRS